MNVVFHGTLIHHLKDLFLSKARTPWTVQRFFEHALGGEHDVPQLSREP